MPTPLNYERRFLTDGGIETTLIFHEGWELPEFAAFPLIDSPAGRRALVSYYERYIHLAQKYGTGFVLESPTWRASTRWAMKLGYSSAELQRLLASCIGMMQDLKDQYATDELPMLVSGCIGPHDDGYQPEQRLSVNAARAYHSRQIKDMAMQGIDYVTAVTMTYPEEAIGLTNAAADLGISSVIAFTVETDGTLPVGGTLAEAIARVDTEADQPPAYYMINCAHPDHFWGSLKHGDWLRRIGGVRTNASRMSHAELDEAKELDAGNPEEFGMLHSVLADRLPNLKVIGGCCGTDHRHIDAAGRCWHASKIDNVVALS